MLQTHSPPGIVPAVISSSAVPFELNLRMRLLQYLYRIETEMENENILEYNGFNGENLSILTVLTVELNLFGP